MDMQALLDEQMRRKLLAPPAQSSGAGAPELGGGNQQKCSGTGGFPSMSASSLGSLGSSGLMNSLLMIAGGGGNSNRWPGEQFNNLVFIIREMTVVDRLPLENNIKYRNNMCIKL